MKAKKPSLRDLFAAHNGKVSDKWDIYVSEYDRLFQPYRDHPVRLLEIGIQNGGSLEVWCKYFTQAQKIVGSDIDAKCERLIFSDPKIAVVVADANTDDAEQRILAESTVFNIIIDDGSHQSGDIVRSFARYFKHLTDGGLYIAEDLHCSYWQDFEGGIFQPYSSIAFFKQLADTVNHEHWGTQETRKSLLEQFFKKYHFYLEEDLLAQVHSVEFVNSICVVRKEKKQNNLLGVRVISGSDALVWDGALQLHGSSGLKQDQTNNPWAFQDIATKDDSSLTNEKIKILTESNNKNESELIQLRKNSFESDQLYLIEMNRLRVFAETTKNQLSDSERIHAGQISSLRSAHEAQIVELSRSSNARETNAQIELTRTINENSALRFRIADSEKHYSLELTKIEIARKRENLDQFQREIDQAKIFQKQIDDLRSQIDDHPRQFFEQELRFSSNLSTITAAFELNKTELRNDFANREAAHIAQLNQSSKKVEDYLVQIFSREKYFEQHLQNLQTEVIKREQTHAAQLLKIQQEFILQLSELKDSNTQQLHIQLNSFNLREKNLSEQLEVEKINAIEQAETWSIKVKMLTLQSNALSQNFDTLRASIFWKLTSPIRWLFNVPHYTESELNKQNESASMPQVAPEVNPLASVQTQIDSLTLSTQYPISMTPNNNQHPHVNSTMSLNDMLSYRNEAFVHNVYHVLLGRAADTEGLQHYLGKVMAGASKVELIIEVSLSKEGLKRNVEVPGLKKEIKRYRLLKTPVFGPLFKACGLSLMDGKIANNIRVVENKLTQIELSISQQLGQLTQAVIANNQKSFTTSNAPTPVARPKASRVPLELKTPQQTIKATGPVTAATPSELVPKLAPTIRAPVHGSASHQALSKNLDISIKNDLGILKDETKLIAFYLPQFHQTKENSEWWGAGFTEWTNAANGKPNFKGHYQPHIPRELGFYDLQNVEVMREQAALAKSYGVHGFCFYYYWFSGRRILERPLDNFLASNVDMPFCLCWANENWTRTWDGDEKSVLLEQGYAEGDEEKFIDDILPFLKDPRCIKVRDKPLLLVYRIKQLPDPVTSIKKWRAAALRSGLPGLHISVVDFYDISDPREVGADALVEFPPHKFNGPNNHPNPMPEFTNLSFAGGLVDYKKVVVQSKSRPQPDFTLYRGIIPGWDNTARRQDTPTIIIHNTPELYGEWLSYLRGYSRVAHTNQSDAMIFINAWNEWGEGCHLEPDLHWGLSFLEETLRSSWYDSANDASTKFIS
jgi:Glycosyltransferase WbsX/Domain of unknown function (DUF4214)